MAFAVNDIVYVNVTKDTQALYGSRYGRVVAVNPNGYNNAYLVDMANDNTGLFIFEGSMLAAVTGPLNVGAMNFMRPSTDPTKR
jgi:hypothetical protein